MENTTPAEKTVMVPVQVPAAKTETNVSIANAFSMNTPNWAKITGDVFLVLAVLGAALMFFVAQMGNELPANVSTILATIAKYSVAIGATIKFACNMIGIRVPEPNKGA